ncbi:MAG: ABC transporter permease, partial [Verrucomicrobium sp.]
NVYAAICLIGFIGLGTDLILGKIGTFLFPWRRRSRGPSLFGKLFSRSAAQATKKPEPPSSATPAATPIQADPPTSV